MEAGAGVESRSSAESTPLHWDCRFNDAGNFDVVLIAGTGPGAVNILAENAVVATSSSRSGK